MQQSTTIYKSTKDRSWREGEKEVVGNLALPTRQQLNSTCTCYFSCDTHTVVVVTVIPPELAVLVVVPSPSRASFFDNPQVMDSPLEGGKPPPVVVAVHFKQSSFEHPVSTNAKRTIENVFMCSSFSECTRITTRPAAGVEVLFRGHPCQGRFD